MRKSVLTMTAFTVNFLPLIWPPQNRHFTIDRDARSLSPHNAVNESGACGRSRIF